MGDNKSFAQTLLDLIPSGEENAVTAKELASLLNCHWRQVTLTINYLRMHDIVICGTTRSGYFKHTNNEELKHFVFSMHSRARKILAAAESAERLLQTGGIDNERR